MSAPPPPYALKSVLKNVQGEMLDADNALKQRVNKSLNRQLAVWANDNLTPQENQISQMAIKSFDENYDVFVKKLELYKTELYKHALKFEKDKQAIYGIPLINVYDLVLTYNQLARAISDKTVNQQTKQAMMSKMIRIDSTLNDVVEMYFQMMLTELEGETTNMNNKELRKGIEKGISDKVKNYDEYNEYIRKGSFDMTLFKQILSAYATLLLMVDNIEKQTFRPIDNLSIREAYNKVLQKDFLRPIMTDSRYTKIKDVLQGDKGNLALNDDLQDLIDQHYGWVNDGKPLTAEDYKKYARLILKEHPGLKYTPLLPKKIEEALAKQEQQMQEDKRKPIEPMVETEQLRMPEEDDYESASEGDEDDGIVSQIDENDLPDDTDDILNHADQQQRPDINASRQQNQRNRPIDLDFDDADDTAVPVPYGDEEERYGNPIPPDVMKKLNDYRKIYMHSNEPEKEKQKAQTEANKLLNKVLKGKTAAQKKLILDHFKKNRPTDANYEPIAPVSPRTLRKIINAKHVMETTENPREEKGAMTTHSVLLNQLLEGKSAQEQRRILKYIADNEKKTGEGRRRKAQPKPAVKKGFRVKEKGPIFNDLENDFIGTYK
jgi:hypothetical protein